MDSDIPIEVLRQKLSYDPTTGVLTWLVSGGKAKVGKPAGCVIKIERNTYLKVTVDKTQTYAHRIAWALSYGYWPEGVDHEDGNGLNNRLDNLREANGVVNGRNCSKHVTNTSGTTGVLWLKSTSKWRAGIKVDGVYHSLGSFTKIEDAIAARKSAEKRFGFHRNHGR